MKGDAQFGFRDAGHFYYPLYQRVQEEWQQGRWPLWEPEENSGMPLLGNPTAAVLYPGKLIYALLPYPMAARVYIMAHAALAFAAMLVTVRSWRVSWVRIRPGGAGLCVRRSDSLPVLQYHLPRRGGVASPRFSGRRSLAHAGQPLGHSGSGGRAGDADPGRRSRSRRICWGSAAEDMRWGWPGPRSRERRRGDEPVAASRPGRSRLWWLVPAVVAGRSWPGSAGTLALAEVLPRHRPSGNPAPALPWMLHVPRAVLLAWGAVGLFFLLRWRAEGWRSPLGVMLSGLAGAAVLSAVLSAAQLLPVLEFTQQTVRAEGEGPHDIYPFSIEPFRLAELVWPNVTGTSFGRNAYWPDAVRLPGVRQKVWVPSLYLGSLGLILAAGGIHAPPRAGSSRLALGDRDGQHAGQPRAVHQSDLGGAIARPDHPRRGSRHRPPGHQRRDTPIRLDRYLRDGDGGIYWWMTTLLPGFRQFRFPAKLFTFAAFGIAALAGMGWDSLQERPAPGHAASGRAPLPDQPRPPGLRAGGSPGDRRGARRKGCHLELRSPRRPGRLRRADARPGSRRGDAGPGLRA